MTDIAYQRLTLECGHTRDAHTTPRSPEPYEIGDRFICSTCPSPKRQITPTKSVIAVETLDPFEIVDVRTVSEHIDIARLRNGDRKIITQSRYGSGMTIVVSADEWKKMVRL